LKRSPKETLEIQVLRFHLRNRNKQSACQASFMGNETFMSGSFLVSCSLGCTQETIPEKSVFRFVQFFVFQLLPYSRYTNEAVLAAMLNVTMLRSLPITAQRPLIQILSVVRVRRIFWTDPYIWGKCFLLCSCCRTPTGRGKPRARARARTRAPREGRAPRYQQHTYCVLLRTHSAPKPRIARAPELVRPK